MCRLPPEFCRSPRQDLARTTPDLLFSAEAVLSAHTNPGNAENSTPLNWAPLCPPQGWQPCEGLVSVQVVVARSEGLYRRLLRVHPEALPLKIASALRYKQ